MKSEKIQDKEIINNGGDLGAIANSLMQNRQNNTILINKDMLPSKGKFYNSEIYAKKMSTIDIKNLSTVNSNNVDGVINGIISRNIIGINVNDVLIGDKLWFIFYLRSITYNDKPYNMRYKCENCGSYNILPMVFNNLTIDYLNDSFNPEIKLPNDDTISVEFPRISDEIYCNMIMKEPDKYSITAIDEQILDLACYIKKINGKESSVMNSYRYMENLDGMSFSHFANTLANVNFGVKTYINVTCDCGEENIIPISFSPEFFMPKIESN